MHTHWRLGRRSYWLAFGLQFFFVLVLAAQTPPAPATAPGAPAGQAPAGRGGGLPAAAPYDFNDHDGWTSIFDGSTLNGWNANSAVWTAENGTITAASNDQRRVGMSYIFTKDEFADFELKLEFKLEGDVHSGIAYRNWVDLTRTPPAFARAGTPPPQIPVDPRWILYGPGCDYDADRRASGNVEDRGSPRRLLARRGFIVKGETGKPSRIIGTLGDPDALMNVMKLEDWNQVHIIARGRQMTQIINGQAMAIFFDDDATLFTPKGVIGWSIESGTGRVSARNLWIRKL